MRSIALFCIWFFCCSPNSLQAQDSHNSIDIAHYSFALSVTDLSNEVNITANLHLNRRDIKAPVYLDLVGKGTDGKGMLVTTVNTVSSNQPLRFVQEKERLVITIPSSLDRDSSLDLVISYHGIPADGLIISSNKFGKRTFFSDNWPNRGHNWLVSNDHPSDKASVDFIVTAPSKYQVISNGILVEETDGKDQTRTTHWREEKNLPLKAMCVGIAAFAVQYAGMVGSVPLWSWVYPDNKDKGFSDYSVGTEVLPFFTDHLGPFPYAKLANVQSTTIFGGMENASAIFYSENSVTGEGKTRQLFAHEIAHQWFGNMATEADWQHLWLSEGFATYLSWMYIEDAFGEDSMTALLVKGRKKVIDFFAKKQSPIVDSSVTNYLKLLNPNTYEKSGWVMHMMRKQAGDSLFWTALRSYYQAFGGKNAVTDDFRKILDSVTGKNWAPFFDQWLYGAGHPILSKTVAYDKVKKSAVITIRQLQPNLFSFPLGFLITGEDVSRKSVRVTERETRVMIPMNSLPRNVTLDPQFQLLFEEK